MKNPAEFSGRFRPAVLTPHELVRGRLLLRVTPENALGAPHCTLIVGPAGFGKTTLLAQAYRHFAARGDPILWLECNQHDADPSHFLNSLYAAASAAGFNTADSEFNTSDFGRRAAGLASDVCLCIDALEHVIATDTEPLIERLLGSLPPRARVLLASRRLPNAWFLERELQGLAVTIEANDLRLTRPELGELLPEPFTPAQVAQVAALTEGWPVAAQLTRLRARDTPSIAEMLERLAHEGLGLFEYLAYKVLEVLSPDQRDLLRVTSILSAITPALANALMQRDDGYTLMSGVLRLAPIVSITSDRDFTIRLHPLLRQYMRRELARSGQEHERALHRQAARALAAAGQILEAVQHALEADDLRLAVEEFDRAGGDELIFTLGPRQVHTLAETLPQAARELSLRLQFTDFLLALVGGHTHLTSELLARLLRTLAAGNEFGHDPGAAWREFAAAYGAASSDLLADLNDGPQSDVRESCAAVERLARLHFPHNEAYLGLILAIEVLLLSRHASTAESRRTLQDYIALCERNHFAPQLPSVNPQRGWLAFLEGDLDAALGFLARPQLKRVDRFAEPEPLLAQLSKVLVATIHYERNEIEQSFAIIDGVFVDPDRTLPETWALTCRIRALCLDALDRPAEADHVLWHEESQARRRDARRLGLIITSLQLELGMRRGQPELSKLEILVNALERELDRADASWLFASSLGRSVVPALTLTARHPHARKLALQLVNRAQACGNQLFEAAGRILLARAEDAAGESTSSRLHLCAALKCTGRMRVVRPYIDIWAKATVPLVNIVAEQTSAEDVEHIRQVLRALDTAVPNTLDGWSTLSERERDVLSALSAHATTKAIAKSLGLSPETVKHHLKRIFAKLGVHSRAEALERLAQLSD
jgi:LuxR family transcriptional regulator, maltose regulon positive regulatory protein